MKNRGFTDKLYFLNLFLSWLFIVICIVITIFSGKLGIQDLSIVSVGLPAVFAELGIHTGFIIWKAKTENINKFGINPETFTTGELPVVSPVAEESQKTIYVGEEEKDDNNVIHNNADSGGRYHSSINGSYKAGLLKCRQGLFGKRNSPY